MKPVLTVEFASQSRGVSMINAPMRARRVAETSFAVIDFETTGLRAGVDRVVEISIVRVDPQESPKLVMDTLINPQRPMAATEIHGIRDEDVADSLAGAMVAAYNVYFDFPFLLCRL